MKYKHIIWDWNGTLLDDLDICVRSINHILLKRNLLKISVNTYRSNFCFPVENFYEKIGLDLNKEDLKETGKEFIGFYNDHFDELKLHKDVLDTLVQIKALGISQSLLSAAMQSMLVDWVEKRKIDNYFEIISGVENIYAKGKIELGSKHIKKLSLNRNKILMVGDTVHDHEVAIKMGVDCALLDYGHNNRLRLEHTGCTVFSNIKQLIKFIN